MNIASAMKFESVKYEVKDKKGFMRGKKSLKKYIKKLATQHKARMKGFGDAVGLDPE